MRLLFKFQIGIKKMKLSNILQNVILASTIEASAVLLCTTTSKLIKTVINLSNILISQGRSNWNLRDRKSKAMYKYIFNPVNYAYFPSTSSPLSLS